MASSEITVAIRSREEVQQALLECVTRKVVDLFGSDLSALILTGSLARGEGSLIRRRDGWEVLGDAEFLVILRDGAKLISDPEFGRVGRQMTRELKELGIACHLDLSAAHVDYFQKMRPHIFAYELRSCGRTLWGDAKVIKSIPAFAAGEIPREDAWRLLCNRIIEQLRIVRRLYSDEQDSWEQTVYVCNKFLLDLGTSLLVFLDQYEPTYQLRAEKIEQLARDGTAARLPFSLAEFSRRVRELTAIKLRPELDRSLGESDLSPQARRDAALSRWLEAVPYARALWEWEVALLVGAEPEGSSAADPWRKLLRAQPAAEKLRGWLYLFSNPEFHFTARQLPRWARHLPTASPRYLTYVAASRLYFSLPGILRDDNGAGAAGLAEVRNLLPLVRSADRRDCQWGNLCEEVVWIYEQFLTRTRH